MENQKKEQPIKKRNAGLIIVVVVAILVLVGLISIGMIIALNIPRQEQEYDSKIVATLEAVTGDIFSGKSYQASDGSVIYFEEDGGFVWYQDDNDHSDNYYMGTFDVYLAGDAQDYIVNELTDYGVTKEELENYYERNEESEMYKEENFCCLVLHTEELIVEGENQADEPYDKNYMGFYLDGFYDAANMDSGQYAYFTLVE